MFTSYMERVGSAETEIRKIATIQASSGWTNSAISSSGGARPGRDSQILVSPWDTFPLGGGVYCRAPHGRRLPRRRCARGHGNPGTDPSRLAPNPAVSTLQGGGVARARQALRIKTASKQPSRTHA